VSGRFAPHGRLAPLSPTYSVFYTYSYNAIAVQSTSYVCTVITTVSC